MQGNRDPATGQTDGWGAGQGGGGQGAEKWVVCSKVGADGGRWVEVKRQMNEDEILKMGCRNDN